MARLRAFRQRPAAPLSFWKEALTEHIAGRGLKVVAQRDLPRADGPGFQLDVVAPAGEQDFTWTIAVFDAGPRLIVFEATGEMVRFEARRAALDAALEGLRW